MIVDRVPSDFVNMEVLHYKEKVEKYELDMEKYLAAFD